MYRYEQVEVKQRNKELILRWSLTVVWFAGILLGFCIALRTKPDIYSLILLVQGDRMMIVGFLSMLIFPFVISTILLRMSLSIWILPIAFLKAFLFSSCCNLIMAFGDAGWLARWLLVFSESLTIPFLLWFWFRNIAGDRGAVLTDTLVCLPAVIAIGCIDYFAVSPLAVKLFTFL